MNKAFQQPGFILLLLLVIGFGCGTDAVAQTAGRIEAIRKLVEKIDKDIAQAEESPDASTTFLTELEVNKNLSPYPAVGIYKTVIKFYYTFGDREKDPYPNRLLKVINSSDRSDRQEYSEFVFNEAEELAFYLEKKDNIERRLYFASARPIRFQQGTSVLNLNSKDQVAVVTSVLKEKANLIEMFRRSLRF